MEQIVNILLAINKAHTVPHRVPDRKPGVGVMSPTIPFPLLRVLVERITFLPDV